MPDQTNSTTLLRRLIAHGLISERQSAKVQSALNTDQMSDPQQLVAQLLQQELVTHWQLTELEAGRKQFLLENGRYLLLEKIGQGGMGAVFRARHTRMKRDVALKVIDPRRAEDQALMDRFRREVAICSRLEHEHIVRTQDVGEDQGSLFLVMEYVEGSDLSSLVRRDGPMSPGEVAAIGTQVAAALGYAHAKGIVHRDIKPSNILLSTAGSSKVLDMGLARFVEDSTDTTITELTQEGSVMGTVDYMSPEQARDSHSVDARSDIYSLGAALYFLLTGRTPYPGGTMMEKLTRLASEAPQPLGQIRPDCPRELDAAIQQMMAKAPEDRFQSAEDVVRALKPSAVERIGGRPVVTTAVQTAAETHRETAYQSPDDTLPALGDDETVYSAIRRRKTRSTAWWWIGGSIIALCAAIAVWLSSEPVRQPVVDADSADSPPTDPVPPADVRVEFSSHFGGVHAIQWSPDGLFLGTGGGDGQCRVWDANTGRMVAIYRGHHGDVVGISWSPDGRGIASADRWGEIHIWEAYSGRQTFEPIRIRDQFFNPGPGNQESICFSPNGNLLAIAAEKKRTVIVWDIEAARPVWSDTFHGGMLRFSRDGSHLAGASFNGDVRVWTTEDGEPVFSLPTDDERRVVAFHPDGRLLVLHKTQIQTWNAIDNQLLQTVDVPESLESGFAWHTVQFSPDGSRCAIDTKSRDLVIVDVLTGEAHPASVAPVNHADVCVVSPDCLRQARTDGTTGSITLENIEQNVGVQLLGQDVILRPCDVLQVLGNRYLQVRSIQHVPNHPANGVRTWDLSNGRPIRNFPEVPHVDNRGRIRGIVDGRITGYRLEGNRAVVEETITVLQSAPPLSDTTLPTVRWAHGGSHVFSENRFLDSREFRMWDAESGALVRTVNLGDELSFRVDEPGWPVLDPGPHISLTADVLVQAYGEDANGEVADMIRVWHNPWKQPTLEFKSSLVNGVWHAALARDGRYLAVHGLDVGTTTVFDTDDGHELATLDTGLPAYPVHYDFSPSGNLLFITRQIWDWRNETLLWECPERDHAVGSPGDYIYRGGAFFSDDTHVVIAQDGQYQIWNWDEDRKLATLFLMPEGDGYAFFNHDTGHWTGTPLSRQHLQFATTSDDGETVWLTPYQYEERIGWENDESQAGLDLSSE